MRSRGLVVAIAIVLAVVAAAAVILYTNQVRQNALGDEATTVVVARQDIPAARQLDPLIADGTFVEINVPNDNVVAGAVTSLDELRGQTTSQPILAREQITPSRLSNGKGATQSAAGVTEGHVGIALSLEGQRAGAGAIHIGDSVAVYVTFGADTIVLKKDLRQVLTPKQIQKFLEAQGGTPNANAPAFKVGADFTATLVPSTRVIQIAIPTVTDANGQQTTSEGSITLMLDLLPADAQGVVFAKEKASVWLGLLPPKNAAQGYTTTEAVLGPSFDRLVGGPV